MIRSVKAVLIKDGYIVQIVNQDLLKEGDNIFDGRGWDALEIIRKVRTDFPKMSRVVLVPSQNGV